MKRSMPVCSGESKLPTKIPSLFASMSSTCSIKSTNCAMAAASAWGRRSLVNGVASTAQLLTIFNLRDASGAGNIFARLHMKELTVIVALFLFVAASVTAQPAAPEAAPGATSSEVQELRQEVRSLTETVKELQQQVKDQQAILEKANITGSQLPQNAEPPASSSPGSSAPALFPTNDASVVGSSATTGNAPSVTANATPAA